MTVGTVGVTRIVLRNENCVVIVELLWHEGVRAAEGKVLSERAKFCFCLQVANPSRYTPVDNTLPRTTSWSSSSAASEKQTEGTAIGAPAGHFPTEDDDYIKGSWGWDRVMGREVLATGTSTSTFRQKKSFG